MPIPVISRLNPWLILLVICGSLVLVCGAVIATVLIRTTHTNLQEQFEKIVTIQKMDGFEVTIDRVRNIDGLEIRGASPRRLGNVCCIDVSVRNLGTSTSDHFAAVFWRGNGIVLVDDQLDEYGPVAFPPDTKLYRASGEYWGRGGSPDSFSVRPGETEKLTLWFQPIKSGSRRVRLGLSSRAASFLGEMVFFHIPVSPPE